MQGARKVPVSLEIALVARRATYAAWYRKLELYITVPMHFIP